MNPAIKKIIITSEKDKTGLPADNGKFAWIQQTIKESVYDWYDPDLNVIKC